SKPAKAQELLTGAQSLFKQRDQYLLPENETRPGPILIIDDNRSLVRLAERALQKDGFNVVTAFSGIDGLRKVKEEKPGLIILDIILPELSGFDILQQVRQQTDVPVIMLTSDNHIDSIKKTMALGADDYLLKPISTVELLTRVHNKLDSSG
ncbi:MAG: response regulator, partial [Dehalococcoidales bacterium]